MERKSPYRNVLARVAPNAEAKTFKVFRDTRECVKWLKTGKNAERVVKCARGIAKIHRWADGRVAVNFYGSVPRERITLAPEKRYTPAEWFSTVDHTRNA